LNEHYLFFDSSNNSKQKHGARIDFLSKPFPFRVVLVGAVVITAKQCHCEDKKDAADAEAVRTSYLVYGV
jgi:FixJ family two-component response regulator